MPNSGQLFRNILVASIPFFSYLTRLRLQSNWKCLWIGTFTEGWGQIFSPQRVKIFFLQWHRSKLYTAGAPPAWCAHPSQVSPLYWPLLPPPPSIFQNQGKAAALLALPGMALLLVARDRKAFQSCLFYLGSIWKADHVFICPSSTMRRK